MSGKKKIMLAGFFALLFGSPFFIYNIVQSEYKGRIFMSVSDVNTKSDAALVLGAGLAYNKQTKSIVPSPVLEDRLMRSIQLYKAGMVKKLVMSGTEEGSYSEPRIMRDFALKQSVNAEDIFLDLNGDRTYESCKNMITQNGFKNAIIVTQLFHLPRALYICNRLGINSYGIAADSYNYPPVEAFGWSLREVGASIATFFEVPIFKS